MTHELLLYFGDTLLGDINKYAKNRHLTEALKSEASEPSADTFTFEINWRLFQRFIARKFTEPASSFLKVGKTRIVFKCDDYVRFGGWLAAKPARSGSGAEQNLQLTFYEYFARLSGDLVCNPSNPSDPAVSFNEAAHLYVKDLIDGFISHAATAGETVDWSYGTVDTLSNKQKSYNDFQTISKALCDAMNNVSGAGKFDVVIRTDPEDYTHQLVDILKPRGSYKSIVVRFPSDGVHKIWASGFSVEETNDFASHIIIAGNGQVGSVEEGEQTAHIGVAQNLDFVDENCYYRQYIARSDLESQNAVNAAAETELDARSFAQETPDLQLVGVPIRWGDNANGLAIGDIFYFAENTDDLEDNSGYYRIIGIDSSWDDNGVESVSLNLLPAEEPTLS